MTEACEKLAPAFAKTGEGRVAEVERLIAPAVVAMGYDVVRVLLSGKQRPRLQIMAERHDGAGMVVRDCVALSRAIEAILDVEDPIAEAYELEVSSPGIDRPLTRPADFERFAGFEAKIETAVPFEGRRRWAGRLLGLEGETVRLETKEGEVALPCAAIAKAKLVLTDDLIAAAERTRATANKGTE
ncbi:MAG: ribosome maturation factor RimP [Alphaproteobacteria bacterium]